MSGPIALHLGGLHPYEQALTLLLAFGPFAVLAVLVAVRRRQDRSEGLPDGPADGVAGERRVGDDGPVSG